MVGFQHQAARQAEGVAVVNSHNILPVHLKGKDAACALEGAMGRQVAENPLDTLPHCLCKPVISQSLPIR